MVQHSANRREARALPQILGLAVGLVLAVAAHADARRVARQEAAAPPATPELSLLDQEPFDLVTLDRINNNAEMKVRPLKDLPDPLPLGGDGYLVFEFMDIADKQYKVPWANVVKVERYEELLLKEGRAHLDAQRYDEAFRVFLFLNERNATNVPLEIRQAIDRCLYEDARAMMQAGNFGVALSALEELFNRDPRYRQAGEPTALIDLIGQCYDKFIEKVVTERDFNQARMLLARVTATYGDRMKPLVERWTGELEREAAEILAEVRQVMTTNDGDAAHRAIRELLYVMPTLAEGHELRGAINEQFPYVYVGVSQVGQSLDAQRIDDWSARRVGRLTHRWLFEFSGLGDEGGKYVFPNGQLQRIDDVGLRYRITVRNPAGGLGIPPLATYQVADRLLNLADPQSSEYFIPWARVVKTIRVENASSVIFELKAPYVRPEALLQIPYFPADQLATHEPTGLYAPQPSSSPDEVVFEINPAYASLAQHVYPRIIERHFPTNAAADEALLRGEIDVVDRVFPGDIPRLSRHPQIVVQPYAIPTVHLLIPNPRNSFMKSSTFRRALHYSINREAIVDYLIAGGADLPDMKVISGPFPASSTSSDQMAYAYDPNVRPRTSEGGKLGIVLAMLTELLEDSRLREAGEENPKVELPELVLAHPDEELAREICRTIQRYWAAIGVKSTLRELPEGMTIPPDNDYDVLFLEAHFQEPLVDAYKLLGDRGIVKDVDPTIIQALQRLDVADSWSDVSIALRRVHRQTHNNATILPLWQFHNYYAYRKNIVNVGENLVTLYQHVGQWQITSPPPPGTEP